jgi:carbohydrate-binding DOMON domain-containing protein
MGENHHESLVKGIAKEQNELLEKSEQGIFIYLDDTHKVCNEKFAAMLGYSSAKEWAETDAPLANVVEEDQDAVVAAYENTMAKLVASSLAVSVKNVKTKRRIKMQLVLVPIAYAGHLFAIEFFNKV